MCRWLYWHINMCIWVQVLTVARGIGCPGAGLQMAVSPDLGGTWTQILWKSSKCSSEPSLSSWDLSKTCFDNTYVWAGVLETCETPQTLTDNTCHRKLNIHWWATRVKGWEKYKNVFDVVLEVENLGWWFVTLKIRAGQKERESAMEYDMWWCLSTISLGVLCKKDQRRENRHEEAELKAVQSWSRRKSFIIWET